MSASDLPELLPCPFCGEHFVEEAESDVPTIHGGNMRAVYCNGCFAEGPTADTAAEAIAAWNTRAGDKRARESVEALQRLAKSFPTDADMIAAGWESPEINEACEAFDEAMRVLAAAPTSGEKT